MKLKLREKNKKKSVPPKLATTGRAKPERVGNPYGFGVDRPMVVIDTLKAMHARKQIDHRQFQAASWYRFAFEICAGARIKSPLGNDLVASSGPSGSRSPTETSLKAADRLNSANRLLGKVDYDVVALIVGQGFSIAAAAARLYPAKKRGPNRADFEVVGRRLREALETLADVWLPAGRGRPRSRAQIFADDAKPMSIVIGEFDQAPAPGTAHARTNWRGKVWVDRKD